MSGLFTKLSVNTIASRLLCSCSTSWANEISHGVRYFKDSQPWLPYVFCGIFKFTKYM
jgi:hypothetical protein